MKEKKINLDEFWNKRYPHGKLPKYAKEIIIEYSKELLELASENAVSSYVACGFNYKDNINIDKRSILDTINQIE